LVSSGKNIKRRKGEKGRNRGKELKTYFIHLFSISPLPPVLLLYSYFY